MSFLSDKVKKRVNMVRKTIVGRNCFDQCNYLDKGSFFKAAVHFGTLFPCIFNSIANLYLVIYITVVFFVFFLPLLHKAMQSQSLRAFTKGRFEPLTTTGTVVAPSVVTASSRMKWLSNLYVLAAVLMYGICCVS